jgi:hypothetical protein
MTIGPVFQYAYLVDDIRAAAESWVATVGAGPFFLSPHHCADRFEYRGTTVEADVSYAFGYSGDSQIQLIQQHDEKASIYRDAYPDGGTGFHHVAMLVIDYASERQRLLDAGFDLVCELWANDIVASYFDTRAAIGAMTELHIRTDRIAATFDRWHHAHLAWDATGDPIRSHVSGA